MFQWLRHTCSARRSDGDASLTPYFACQATTSSPSPTMSIVQCSTIELNRIQSTNLLCLNLMPRTCAPPVVHLFFSTNKSNISLKYQRLIWRITVDIIFVSFHGNNDYSFQRALGCRFISSLSVRLRPTTLFYENYTHYPQIQESAAPAGTLLLLPWVYRDC